MVGFSIGIFFYEIGNGPFLSSFFYTVAHRLENRRWGSRFPIIMKELYDGELKYENIDGAAEELKQIREELKKFPPKDVVWDFNDLSKKPPWGDDISDDITDLSNYYVTSRGKDFIDMFFRALDFAKEKKSNMIIKSVTNFYYFDCRKK